MQFYTKKYKEFSSLDWDKKIDLIDGATNLHSSAVINYFCAFDKKIINKSFLVYDEKKDFVAAVSIAISKKNKKNILSFGNNLCPTPAIKDVNEKKRRKILLFVWNEIDLLIKKFSIRKIKMMQNPICNLSMKKKCINTKNVYENLKYSNFVDVLNTFIVDLKEQDQQLFENLSKTRKKEISRAIKSNIKVKSIKDQNIKEIKKEMKNFRLSHLYNAKKVTRPLSTWKIMNDNLINKNCNLFVAYIKDTPISYLYCGEFNKMAWGWSQSNTKKIEKKDSVRHYLEWCAIEYYKKNNFNYYDIGIRYYENDILNKFSKKEIYISDFKEKYGSHMYPVIFFYSVLDNKTRLKFSETIRKLK